MKTTFKVVTLMAVICAGLACGKRNSSMKNTKASEGAEIATMNDMAYESAPAGQHQYLTLGTDGQPLQYLKNLDKDKRIYLGVTIAARLKSKTVKSNEYHMVVEEFLTCNDGPSSQEYAPGKKGKLQYKIFHQVYTGEWAVGKGAVTGFEYGGNIFATFQRDPAPAATTDPVTKRVTKHSRPASGKLFFITGVGEAEVQSQPTGWPLTTMRSPYEYTKFENADDHISLQDAITKIGSACQGVSEPAPATQTHLQAN